MASEGVWLVIAQVNKGEILCVYQWAPDLSPAWRTAPVDMSRSVARRNAGSNPHQAIRRYQRRVVGRVQKTTQPAHSDARACHAAASSLPDPGPGDGLGQCPAELQPRVAATAPKSPPELSLTVVNIAVMGPIAAAR